MLRTRVKFCGIMNAEDAGAAIEAGADAIGMVFFPRASRCITVQRAKEILAILPPFVTAVGLFVDQPVNEILQISHDAGLRVIQLHGHEAPEVLPALSHFTVIKAVRTKPQTLRDDLQKWREAIHGLSLRHLRGLLMETDATQAGGTGQENDWQAIARVKQSGGFAGLPAMIAAGGLHAENVGAVVRLLRPFAVDVSSGIESSRGHKSAEKMRAFVAAVRQADEAAR